MKFDIPEECITNELILSPQLVLSERDIACNELSVFNAPGNAYYLAAFESSFDRFIFAVKVDIHELARAIFELDLEHTYYISVIDEQLARRLLSVLPSDEKKEKLAEYIYEWTGAIPSFKNLNDYLSVILSIPESERWDSD